MFLLALTLGLILGALGAALALTVWVLISAGRIERDNLSP